MDFRTSMVRSYPLLLSRLNQDNKLVTFFLLFPENILRHFLQIVSLGDNLHEMSKSIF